MVVLEHGPTFFDISPTERCILTFPCVSVYACDYFIHKNITEV